MSAGSRKETKMVFRSLELGVILAIATICTARCESLPEAPKAQVESKVIYGVWAATLGAHLADYELTERCVHSTVCHEGVLPGWIWKNKPVFIATEVGMSVAQIEISKELRKHHHRKIANVWNWSNLAAFSVIDVYVGNLIGNSPKTADSGSNPSSIESIRKLR